MTRAVTTALLEAGQIAQVFPLVRARLPGIDLPRWRRHASTRVRKVEAEGRPARPSPIRQGIVVAWSERGYACGLAEFRIHNDLGHGRTLAVDQVMAIDLLDPAVVVHALVRDLRVIAAENGCAALHLRAAANDENAARALGAEGFVPDDALFCLPLTPAAAPPPWTRALS
ncbi:MAG: hypothetical protein EAZ99_13770 [Alphaproteobacteria bacterium]|nr:MAG: hypothetical protein EAZ99_13770 [Alphaproteobacteria bacterium]